MAQTEARIDGRPPTFSELCEGPAVTVYVGPQSRPWTIPQNLLLGSGVNIHRNDMVPGSHQVFFPELSPQSFGLFINWLYGVGVTDHRFLIFGPFTEHFIHETAPNRRQIYIDAFSFAEQLDLDEFMEIITAAYMHDESNIMAAADSQPNLECLNLLYEKTNGSSHFRLLMVCNTIFGSNLERLRVDMSTIEDIHPELIQDIFELYRRSNGLSPGHQNVINRHYIVSQLTDGWLIYPEDP